MRNLKQISSVAAVFTAVILGAGFASGQELFNFFVKFGVNGFYGIAVAGVIFAVTGWSVLELCLRNGITSYSRFFKEVLGNGLGFVVETIVACFMFILFATMLSASGAALNESFSMPAEAGSALMAVLCLFCFTKDISGIIKASAILAPIMAAGGVFIGLFTFFTHADAAFLQFGGLKGSWIVSAVVYASYNIITAVTVLASMYESVPNGHVAFWGPALGGLVVSILGICMALPLYANYPYIQNAQIPLLKIAANHGDIIKFVYLAVLISAIFTTAAANGFAFLSWLSSEFNVSGFLIKLLVCVSAVFAAQIGFSSFVGSIYPIFGYIGFFVVLVILSKNFLQKITK